jgi:hypothetical protein
VRLGDDGIHEISGAAHLMATQLLLNDRGVAMTIAARLFPSHSPDKPALHWIVALQLCTSLQ